MRAAEPQSFLKAFHLDFREAGLIVPSYLNWGKTHWDCERRHTGPSGPVGTDRHLFAKRQKGMVGRAAR